MPIAEAFTADELAALQYDRLAELVQARREWARRVVETLPWAAAGVEPVGLDAFLQALHFVRSRTFSVHYAEPEPAAEPGDPEGIFHRVGPNVGPALRL